MIKYFFWSRKWLPWAWGGLTALLISIFIQVEITVWINDWYRGFYDLLQMGGTVEQFWKKLLYVAYLVFPYIGIICVSNWFGRIWTLRWRQAMTYDYIPQFLESTKNIEGASQRIQEDCAKLAEILQGLGLQAIRAVFTLIAFIPVLWRLSETIELPFLPDVPGSLVWASLIVSIGGMGISWLVGYYLPHLEYNNQKTEHAFRKELVYVEDNRRSSGVPQLFSLFTGLRLNHERLYLHYGYFDLWVNIFDQALVFLPYIVAGPFVVMGVLPLGALVQISNAFGKVQGSLSLFINNWTVITSLRSVIKRLREFQGTLP